MAAQQREDSWTEQFVHNEITYTITWRPKPNVVFRMHQEGEPKVARETMKAIRAFKRKNRDRIEAMRRRH